MTCEEYEASLYLAHHGIKGQKWGIRRFQNEDGTYTEEGRRRFRTYDTAMKQLLRGARVNRDNYKAEIKAVRERWRNDRKEADRKEADRKRKEAIANAKTNYKERAQKNAFIYRGKLRNAKNSDVLISIGKDVVGSIVLKTLSSMAYNSVNINDSYTKKYAKSLVGWVLKESGSSMLGNAGLKAYATLKARSKASRKRDAELKKRKGY